MSTVALEGTCVRVSEWRRSSRSLADLGVDDTRTRTHGCVCGGGGFWVFSVLWTGVDGTRLRARPAEVSFYFCICLMLKVDNR